MQARSVHNHAPYCVEPDVFFRADDGVHGFELWVSDGTAAGTRMVKDIHPGANNSLQSNPYFAVMNGRLYFEATDGVNGRELWVSDGTAAGTQMLKDINPGSSNSTPTFLTVVNNRLFFAAFRPDVGTELWVSDGTTAGTRLVKDIHPGANDSGILHLTASVIGSFLRPTTVCMGESYG